MTKNQNTLEFSPLAKTWIFDVDGTLVKHNGHKNGGDVLLDGVKEFFENISAEDKVILLTAREGEHLENLRMFLIENKIRYDYLLCDMPFGERILVNDEKPSGLPTAYAVNKKRDEALNMRYIINENI
jgi:hypothetical protein